MQPGNHEVVDVLGEQAGPGQGVGHRLLGQRQVGGLAEALLPDLAGRLTGDPPPVQELPGHRGPGQLDDQRRRTRVEEERGGRVTATALVTGAGQSGTYVGQHRQGRSPGRSRCGRGPQSAQPGA